MSILVDKQWRKGHFGAQHLFRSLFQLFKASKDVPKMATLLDVFVFGFSSFFCVVFRPWKKALVASCADLQELKSLLKKSLENKAANGEKITVGIKNETVFVTFLHIKIVCLLF